MSWRNRSLDAIDEATADLAKARAKIASGEPFALSDLLTDLCNAQTHTTDALAEVSAQVADGK